MVSRLIDGVDGRIGMAEDDDGLITISIEKNGFLLDVLLGPDELAEFGRWIREHELETMATPEAG